MSARYDGDRVITDHAPPWLLPEWTESPVWPYGHVDAQATTRTVRRYPRPAEPARWMVREAGGRGNWVTWVDVDNRNRTTRTPITFHRQTRTVTDWADVEATPADGGDPMTARSLPLSTTYAGLNAAAIIGRDPDPDTWRTNPGMRRTFIGGSDAAATLGLDPYTSPVALWLEKTGRTDGFAGNAATEWGHRLEPVVADWLAEARPDLALLDPGERTWRHPERPWMACTPDRIAIDPARDGFGVVQIKTTGWRSASEWEAGDAPDQHRVQLAHEMEVLGASWGVLVCLVDGRYPHVVEQDPDPDVTEAIVAAEARFWASLDGDSPPLVGHLDEAADLAAVWHPDPDAAVELDGEAAAALAELHDIRAEAKALDATEKRLRAVIEAALGEATVGTVDGVKAVTWGARTEVDVDLLAAEHPDVVHACSVPTFSATALRKQFPQLATDATYRRVAGRTFKPLAPKDATS